MYDTNFGALFNGHKNTFDSFFVYDLFQPILLYSFNSF